MTALSREVVELYRRTGAYLEGHFRLTSGLHSPEYLQSALVLQHPSYAEWLGARLADRLQALDTRRVNVVVSPAIGGLIIGHEVARALHVRHIFTERQDGKMTLRRGFSIGSGEIAVVVEDVITTGGSTLEVVELLREAGAEPVAAGSIIDRSGGRADVRVPRLSLAMLQVIAYDPAQCPLCAQGIPCVKPGSRPGA